MKELAYTWGGKGNDERETPTEIILSWSDEHDHLSMHNTWSAQCHPPTRISTQLTQLHLILIETDFDIDPNKENQLRLTSEESLVSARLGGPKEPPMWPKHVVAEFDDGQREGQNA